MWSKQVMGSFGPHKLSPNHFTILDIPGVHAQKDRSHHSIWEAKNAVSVDRQKVEKKTQKPVGNTEIL